MPMEQIDLLPLFMMVVVDLITSWGEFHLESADRGVCLHVWVLP